MKFIDLPGQDAPLLEEILRSITEILERGDFILGKGVEALEAEIARYLNVDHAISVSSGTDALLLSLLSLELPQGSEVLTTPFTFFATSEAIVNAGLVPVYVDIDPRTYNVDPAKLEEALTPRTRAILPVHLFGQPARMDQIMPWAQAHGLKVIEDCAQSFGASLNGQKTGSFGDLGAFSFYPTKNLGAYGDAGMITTNDSALAETIRILRNQGSRIPYRHEKVGFNSRCDTLQAAVLKAKLPHVDDWNARRRVLAALYGEQLEGTPDLQLPLEGPGEQHVYHQFTIQTPHRDELRAHLQEAQIPTATYYDLPLHRQEALLRHPQHHRMNPRELPNVDLAAQRVLSLPIFPTLRDTDILEVSQAIRSFVSSLPL